MSRKEATHLSTLCLIAAQILRRDERTPLSAPIRSEENLAYHLNQITAANSFVMSLQTAKAPPQPRNPLDPMKLGTALPDTGTQQGRQAQCAYSSTRQRVVVIVSELGWVEAGLSNSLSFPIMIIISGGISFQVYSLEVYSIVGQRLHGNLVLPNSRGLVVITATLGGRAAIALDFIIDPHSPPNFQPPPHPTQIPKPNIAQLPHTQNIQ